MQWQAATVVLFLGMVGCAPAPVVSQEGTYVDPNLPPGMTSAARTYFEANVRDALVSSCAQCHAAGTSVSTVNFLPSDPRRYYTSLIAEPGVISSPATTSRLITYGGVSVAAAVHPGNQFVPVQEAEVLAWIDLEVNPPEAPTPPGGSTLGTGAPITVDPSADPQQLFSSTVSPLIQTQCVACHEGTGGPVLFGSSGAGDDYGAVESNSPLHANFGGLGSSGGFQPGNARLINKGPHAGASWWTPEEIDVLLLWLATEYTVRGGEAPTSTTTPGGTSNLLAQFVGCMTLQDWGEEMELPSGSGNYYNMGDWGSRDASGNDKCYSCHSDGEYYFFAHNDIITMYNGNRMSYFAAGFFTIGSDTGGNAMVVPAFDKLQRKCNGENLHPICEGDGAAFEQRLQEFYDDTMTNLAIGNCGPARFIDQ